jgi:limonene-1,2-epoxide hydrolase
LPSNTTTVLAFCAAWAGRDVARIAAYLAADAVWDNVPIGVVAGRDAIAARIGAVLARVSEIEFIVRHVAETAAGTVLTERLDRFVVDGRRIELKLMGLFEVRNGAITLWRDYFDLAQYRAQMAGLTW